MIEIIASHCGTCLAGVQAAQRGHGRRQRGYGPAEIWAVRSREKTVGESGDLCGPAMAVDANLRAVAAFVLPRRFGQRFAFHWDTSHLKELMSMNADIALMNTALRTTFGFSNWPSAVMGQLLSHSRLRRYARSDFVSCEGNKEILLIVSGHLRVDRIENKDLNSMVGLIGPGMVVGLSALFTADLSEPYSFSAFDEAVVVHMPGVAVHEVLDRAPRLWRNFTLMALLQHRRSLTSLLQRTQGRLQRRLAATIANMADLYGANKGSERRIRLRLTQADLAILLQVTRQSVNKELRGLAGLGLISVEYNTISVLDPVGLNQLIRDG